MCVHTQAVCAFSVTCEQAAELSWELLRGGGGASAFVSVVPSEVLDHMKGACSVTHHPHQHYPISRGLDAGLGKKCPGSKPSYTVILLEQEKSYECSIAAAVT